ncbi:unnamed protein product, partial [Musa textilis]
CSSVRPCLLLLLTLVSSSSLSMCFLPRPLYTIDRHVVLCVWLGEAKIGTWISDYEMESADGYLLLYLRVVILITRTAPTPLVLTS